jgi:nitrite reductase/ring-hydroxylating ferredoxin subunit
MPATSLICLLNEIPDPGAREFTIGEGDWPLRGFVVRYQNQVRAFVNKCPHAGSPLNLKPDMFFAPDAPLLQCTTHGARFEPLTGACVQGPCAGRGLHQLTICLYDGCVLLSDAQEPASL